MNQTILIALVSAAVVAAALIALVIAWVRKDAQLRTSEALRESEKAQHERAMDEVKAGHEKAIAELKEGQQKAIDAARTALALENEKTLKAREEALKQEAAETMKTITGGLDRNIQEMKAAFEAQKKSQAEESSAIKTQFAETVRHLKEQTDTIGNKAETLASALKGQNKMQGIFGETILENILQAEGLREGHDYDAEFWLRDRKGNLIQNEETGRHMRPDFALHFPDDTDVLIDAKVSLSALADYFDAETPEERAAAARRNLESIRSHIKELTSKEYQKYVEGRKTLDYVIMFIPNYGAYQLAKQEDPDVFAEAFRQNILITPDGFVTNHAGGVLGGISTGQPVTVSLAIKPTSSIRVERRSVNRANEPVMVQTLGRHDPCVGIRATPIAEAMLALVLIDHALRHRGQCGDQG